MKRKKQKMKEQRDFEEIEAAVKYAKECGTSDLTRVHDAFLAGIDWLREKRAKKPEREYYGG